MTLSARRVAWLSLLLVACSGALPQDNVIGDASPRAQLGPTVLDVVLDGLDAMAPSPVRVQRWTSTPVSELSGEILGAEQIIRTSGLVAAVGHSGSKNTLMVLPV